MTDPSKLTDADVETYSVAEARGVNVSRAVGALAVEDRYRRRLTK